MAPLRVALVGARVGEPASRLTCESGRRETVEYDPDIVYPDSYAAAIRHFAEALRANEPFETSAEDNLETLELVEDAYRAAGRRGLV